jgi:DNA-binding MarR family transcriptional regulator
MESKAWKFMKVLHEIQETLSVRDVNLKYCNNLGTMECYLMQFFFKESRPINMNELAKVLNVSYSRVTRIIDNLVAKRLVIRVNSEEDRRKWFVELTEEGKYMSEITEKRLLDNQIQTLSKLPQNQIDDIYKALCMYKDAFVDSAKDYPKRGKKR